MTLRGIAGRARRSIRRTASFFTGEAVVLLYHRVFDPSFDPLLLSVSRENFNDQIEHLRSRYTVLSLRELLEALDRGRVPRQGVAVTFDDGYGDNASNARPVLERHGVPATVFVASGYVEAGREFWWDELERVLFLAPRLPERVCLTVAGAVYEWDVESAARMSVAERLEGDEWSVLREDNPTPLHKAYRELHALLSPLTAETRGFVMSELRTQTGDERQHRPDYLAMTREQVRALAAGGLVEVGAHTVTHPVLSALSPEAAAREIRQSKRDLEEVLSAPVTSFAYPYGSRGAYSEQNVAAVRGAGLTAACSNFGGTVRTGADRYQLNRTLVRNWRADEFARRLRDAFGG